MSFNRVPDNDGNLHTIILSDDEYKFIQEAVSSYIINDLDEEDLSLPVVRSVILKLDLGWIK